MTEKKGMVRKRLSNIIKHEWKKVFTSLNSTAVVLILPPIITVQVFAYVYVATEFLGVESLLNIVGNGMEKWVAAFPALQDLQLIDQFQAFVFAQIPLYLLLIPCLIALSIATCSIVEEKQTKTLEPLLATPVRTWELLLGKSLAGAIPSLIMSWVCAGLFIALTMGTGYGYLLEQGLNAQWLISLFLLVPLVSVLAFMLGVVASTRAGDAKSAQNMGLVIILPIFAIMAVQLMGVVVFTAVKLLALSAVMAIACFFVLRLAMRLFQRESVVVRWR